MSTSTSFSSIPASGMRDMLPKETALRDWALASLVKNIRRIWLYVYKKHLLIENISQLKAGEGGENLNLIFEILKRGDKLEKTITENIQDTKKLISELSVFGLTF